MVFTHIVNVNNCLTHIVEAIMVVVIHIVKALCWFLLILQMLHAGFDLYYKSYIWWFSLTFMVA